MWPFDRSAPTAYARIGRRSVERWDRKDASLTLQATIPMQQDPAPSPLQLAGAIRTLFSQADGARVSVLLESSWAPVVLVDTGSAPLTYSQLHALARHRYEQHHSDGAEPVASWELRFEYRIGRRHAIAYGIPSRLKQSLIAGFGAARVQLISISPAFSWGLDRLRPWKAWPGSTGWFAWPEQDRTLVARLASRHPTAFNAGAPRVTDAASLQALIEIEERRSGIVDELAPIAAATWGPSPGAGRDHPRVIWSSVDRSGTSMATANPQVLTGAAT